MKPTIHQLLSKNPGVMYREREEEVSRDHFNHLKQRVQNGLEWGVGAIISDNADNVLLIRQRGQWTIPGGGVEPGESLGEALSREVYEETGVEISSRELQAVTKQTAVHKGNEIEFCFATYTASPTSKEITEDPGVRGEDIDAVDWVQALPENTLDRKLIADFR